MKKSDFNSDAVTSGAATALDEALTNAAQVVQMAQGLVLSRAIFATAELGIADYLKDGGAQSAEEIAQATNMHAPSLYRLLRMMAGFGFFVEDEEQRFSLTPLSATLHSEAPGYARSTIRSMAGSMAWGTYGEFLHSVKTGETAIEKAFGEPVFDYLSTRPELATMFNEAMIGFHGEEKPAVAAAYDFSGIGVLCDVGGGTGSLLTTILQANPELKGILHDLPHVIDEARIQIEEKNLSERCEIVPGSFFDSIPSGADAYILSHIIHDWDERRCLQILENCRRAMPQDGKLLLVEMVIPPGNEMHPAKILDVMMLMFTGGKERTEQEYAALFVKGGFKLTTVIPTPSAVSVIEAVPV